MNRLSQRDRERLTRALQIIEHGLVDEHPEYRYAERCGAVRAILTDVLGLDWRGIDHKHTTAPTAVQS